MNVTNVNYVSSLRVLSVYPKLLPAKYRSFRLYVRAYVYVCMCALITRAQNPRASNHLSRKSFSLSLVPGQCSSPHFSPSFHSLYSSSLLVFTSIPSHEDPGYIDPSRVLFARIPTNICFRYRYFETWLQRWYRLWIVAQRHCCLNR